VQTAKLTFLILLFSACSPHGPHKPLPGADSQVTAQGAPSYAQVRPIFEKNCAACHPGQRPPNWLDFNQAQVFARSGVLERRVFTEQTMPPRGSPQAASITDSERATLANWARAGGPLEAVAAQPGPGVVAQSQPALQQQCFQCHGEAGAGNPSRPGVPRLAGQNETYLALQIASFKWRTRLDPSNDMNEAAANLSQNEIAELAAFFAKAEPPPPDTAAPSEFQPLFERGKTLATDNCIACHMSPDYNNKSNAPEVPLLAGQREVYLRNQLLYYRKGERINEVMNTIAKELSDVDITALSLYFSRVR